MVFITLLHALNRACTVHALITSIVKEAETRHVPIGTELLNSTDRSIIGTASKLNEMNNDDDDGLEFLDSSSLNSGARQSAVIMNSTDHTSLDTPSSYASMINESAEIIRDVSDDANSRSSRLIAIRSEQNKQLNPKDFFRLYNATMGFVAGIESLSGRLSFGLKGPITSQVIYIYSIYVPPLLFHISFYFFIYAWLYVLTLLYFSFFFVYLINSFLRRQNLF